MNRFDVDSLEKRHIQQVKRASLMIRQLGLSIQSTVHSVILLSLTFRNHKFCSRSAPRSNLNWFHNLPYSNNRRHIKPLHCPTIHCHLLPGILSNDPQSQPPTVPQNYKTPPLPSPTSLPLHQYNSHRIRL